MFATQVPLGVILKDENVLEDMIEIMLEMHQYVPTESSSATDEITNKVVSTDKLHYVLQ